MKKINILLILSFVNVIICKAQTNFLDSYIGSTVTVTTIGNTSNLVLQPTDLDFKPNTNELWVVTYGSNAGGSAVIFFNAGLPNQTSQYRKDSHSSHFMIYPSALAFGDDGKWAGASENLPAPSNTFMGPALWTSDTSIFARVFQSNYVGGLPLGSHYDMLHQSPLAMGIAHDTNMVYWVLDGHNGNVCKYDYVAHHGPGYDNHSAGKIWRYTDVTFSRVPNIPSHAVMDKESKWLYYIDGGTKKVKRMDTNSGTNTGPLTTPPTGQETLSSYTRMEFATVEVLDSLSTQPSGIDYYNGRLLVSDFTTGDIYLYNTAGSFILLDTIVTGRPGMAGIKVGPDGRIWCVNFTDNKIYRLDITLPTLDVAVVNIVSPVVENYLSNFYSTYFNACDVNLTPSVQVANTGSTIITDLAIEMLLDGISFATIPWSGTLAPGTNTIITFPSSGVPPGNHTLESRINLVNGSTDQVELNNHFVGAFRAINPPNVLPVQESFSAATFPPPGWNYINYNPHNFMSRVLLTGSNGALKMYNFSGDFDITGQKDYFMSPLIDMSVSSGNTWLIFNVAHAQYPGTSDALEVLVSNDCGFTWSQVYNKTGAALATTSPSSTAFTPNASQWRADSVDLTTWSGQAEVLVMFKTTSDFGNNVYIDDIFIGDIPVGIAENLTGDIVNIYPNPVTSMFYVEYKMLNSEVSFNLVNALGEIVQSRVTGNKGSEKFDLSTLPDGVYLLRIDAGEESIVKKIIKQ